MANPTIDGLISGLKTNDLITQLMQVERAPLTTIKNQQNQATLRAQAVQGIQSQVTSLQTALENLVSRSQLNAKTVSTDTPSSSPVVLTASATSETVNGSFRITVSQLATATQAQSSAAIGTPIDPNVTLGTAGFRLTPVTSTTSGAPATFSLNGQTVEVDDNTTLDDGTSHSLLSKINASAAGVTASLVADAAGRPKNRIQIVGGAGQALQVGALGDTSNMLRLLSLNDATVEGYTASHVTSSSVTGGALSTTITINGVNTTINQTDNGFSSSQNAAFIAAAINTNSANQVRATDNGDGTFTLTQKTAGSQRTIDVTTAEAGTGLTVAQTKNGTDRLLGTAPLGVADIGKSLSDARLSTPITGLDGNNAGSFKINGVEISYRSTDSISSVVNRINSSTAGVTAYYDPIQDRLRLTANQTGARAISFADVTGNFLAATGLATANQVIGQNATLSIDSVNGGQPLSSASNTVTDLIPGLTLNLKSTSQTPVTVTVGQNPSTTVSLVKSFVDKFNTVLSTIATQTDYDPDTRQQAILTGDTGILSIQRQLRSLVSSSGTGMAGSIKDLSGIGLSFGAVGSAVGTTNKLTLDETKLTQALIDNPQAVTSVLSSFSGSLGSPSGTGNVVSATGTPTGQRVDGRYYVKVLDSENHVEVRFVGNDGRELSRTTGRVTPGSEDATLIPGVKLKFGSNLAVGEDAVSLKVDQRGVTLPLQDYLKSLLGDKGLFKARADAATRQQAEFTRRLTDTQARIDQKEADLNRKFQGLEVALSRIQTQSNAVAAQIARLSGSTQQQ